MKPVGKKETSLTFEQAMTRLDEITAGLDRGTIPLDDSLALFSEGARLIDFCNKTLKEADLTLQELFPPEGRDQKNRK